MKLALALLFVGAGITLIFSGLTGEPLTPALREVLAGRDPHGRLSKGDTDNNGEGIAGSGTTPDVPAPPDVLVPHAPDASTGSGPVVVPA